jgi:hypothetical protein
MKKPYRISIHEKEDATKALLRFRRGEELKHAIDGLLNGKFSYPDEVFDVFVNEIGQEYKHIARRYYNACKRDRR